MRAAAATVVSALVCFGLFAWFAPSTARADGREESAREQVDKLLAESLNGEHPYLLRARFGREAVTRLAPLLMRHRDDPDLHFQAAIGWIAAADENGPLAPIADALEHAAAELYTVRRLDPIGAREEDVAFELALLRSKQGRFEESLVEYDRAIAAHSVAGPYPGGRDPLERSPGRAALIYGNSAETLMAMGRLPEAIARYRAAVELTPADQGHLASLALWGLAVALDRDGQDQRSRAAARSALARDPKMADLDDPNVFFMPDGEKLYYMALGQLAAGHPEIAAELLRRYLDTHPTPLKSTRAKEHLAQLAATPTIAPTDIPKASSRPVPQPVPQPTP